ncbi:MAG: SLC13 family permease [Candidatus Omnitrophota bacterium]|nr:SLC13 family permease [Candidatus Omnitrophota bacterium]
MMMVYTQNGMHAMNFVCLLTFLVFIFIFGLIIWEKIPRMYLAICGAVFVIVLGVFDINEAINTVSWETIGFLLGMFLLVEILVEAGFFRWVALVLAKKLNYEPIKILIFFPLLSFGLSAFVNSITVMVFLSVATLELSRLLKFDPVPVVIAEVVLANIGGAGTLVGDPPNVILGTVLGFNFNDFLIHNAPIAILAALAALGVSFFMSKNKFLKLDYNTQLEGIKNIQPSSQIKDWFLLKLGLIGMGVALVFLIGRPLFERFGIPMHVSTSSLLPAFLILTFGGRRVYKHHFMRRIDAETIMFFIGLFIMIGALEKRFIIQMAANFLADIFKGTTGFVSSIFWGSGIISAFVDNVPLAMAMTFIIKQSVASKIVNGAGILVWATSLGVDLGGNLTPIGASANVVAYSALEKEGIKIGWGRWIKLALPPGLAALLVSYLGILLKLHFKFY